MNEVTKFDHIMCGASILTTPPLPRVQVRFNVGPQPVTQEVLISLAQQTCNPKVTEVVCTLGGRFIRFWDNRGVLFDPLARVIRSVCNYVVNLADRADKVDSKLL